MIDWADGPILFNAGGRHESRQGHSVHPSAALRSGRARYLQCMRLLGALLLAGVVSMSVTAPPGQAAAAERAVPAGAACSSSVTDGIAPPTAVPGGLPGFHASWYGQSGYMTLCPGQSRKATVAYYNSGSEGWLAGRLGGTAYLGTWGPEPGQDQASPLGGDGTNGSPNTGWPRYNRIAVQPTDYVGPGQIGWFQFTVQAPATAGTYRLYLRPLIEGTTWMEDYGVFWTITVPTSDGSLAGRSLPATWPRSLQLGLASPPGDASRMLAATPFGFRYQYLTGGANTGRGWATWNPDGTFVSRYVQESIAAGMTPVFSYYQVLQSAPGDALSEPAGDYANLASAATMRAIYEDLRLLFQRTAPFAPKAVVVQVEPDLWGFIQQRWGDDASRAPVQVGASGMVELSGLPDTAAGFAQAIVRLRDLYAPNVLLGYHLSVWGTGHDILLEKPSDAGVDLLSARAATFYGSLRAMFDVSFAEFDDRDAGFKQLVDGDGGAHWWAPADHARNLRFLGAFSRTIRLGIVEWQIPLGNTRMRAVNNSWGHYQDNLVESLLETNALRDAYVAAGVIAFLFGGGAAGTTCACDAQQDGVTDPPPINGNVRTSVSSDDDGGFFMDVAARFYASGPTSLAAAVGSTVLR